MRAALSIALVVGAASAAAQWSVQPASEGSPAPVAVAVGEEGNRLEVFLDGGAAVRLRFVLGEGFRALAAGRCPTYQIDRHPPASTSYDDSACRPERRASELLLGRVRSGRIESRLLHRLVNGDRIVFRYGLEGGGYGETAFSLAGSKGAIRDAIGRNLRIIAK